MDEWVKNRQKARETDKDLKDGPRVDKYSFKKEQKENRELSHKSSLEKKVNDLKKNDLVF